MRLTILALVTDAFGGRGGIAQYNRDLLGALSSVAHINVLPRGVIEAFDLPSRIEQRAPRNGRIAYSIAAVHLAMQRRPDIVFCGHLFMAPLAALVARQSGARLVLQLHGIEAWKAPGSIIRRAVERADLVLCVSRYTRAKVLNWATLSPHAVVVLPNTVGEAYTPGDRAEARRSFGLADEQVIVSVGRLAPEERYKGQDRVIEALAAIAVGRPLVRYLIAGDGADRARLEDLARREGIADRVHFLGHVPADRLPDLYRAADLFVLASTGEGFGIVFLEAMMSGTPALGFASAGAADALCDGALGRVAQPATLSGDIIGALNAPRPDPFALAAAVRSRFGRDAFAARACRLFRDLAA